jgi:phosphoribosylamine--glycine ligase
MKVLVVIGGGGREHALAWKLSASPRVQQVYVAPGNGGTALAPHLRNVPITDVAALRDWALKEKIALTVVGPEQPLAAGVVDDFRAHGLRIFGPTRAAAQLESSKAFSKDFMKRHGIPTAAYETFTDPVAAHACVERLGAPIVVKADGLAAGKGVVVAATTDEAHAAIDDMLGGNTLGVAHNEGGARVVIEEFLAGEEASFIVLCDGRNVAARWPPARTTSACSTATRAPTPAAWARTRRPRWSRRGACARDARDHPAHRHAAWRATASPSPASCTPG